MQIEPEVHFCRRLASAVLSPVHAVSHQLNDRGVHRMDLDLEASQQTLALAPCSKARTGILEMPQHRPEQLFDKLRVASLVRVGESVFGRWSDAETR